MQSTKNDDLPRRAGISSTLVPESKQSAHPRLVAEELESLPLERRFNRGGRWPSRGEMLRAESPHLHHRTSVATKDLGHRKTSVSPALKRCMLTTSSASCRRTSKFNDCEAASISSLHT
eukprot:2349892-Amphidinium_carterae.1